MEAEGLLLDILANPHDDVPRLILADWLDDRGTHDDLARAEFIRAQVRLYAMPPDDPERPTLEADERRLRKRHERQWLGDLRDEVHGWAFSRGFLSHLSLDVTKLLRLADRLARTHPIDSVRLTAARERHALARLAGCDYLSKLTSLDLSNNYLDRNDVGELFSSPHLAGLVRLRFNDNPYGYDVVDVLAESRELAGLRALELRRTNLTDNTAMMLAHSATLAGLAHLDLRGNTIGRHARQYLESMFREGVRF